MKQRVLPGQIGIDEIIKENEKMAKFSLNVAEKGLIRAYYKYRVSIMRTPKIMDVLMAFDWENPKNRHYGAFRDFMLDDNEHSGKFYALRNAIEEYLQELDSKERTFLLKHDK